MKHNLKLKSFKKISKQSSSVKNDADVINQNQREAYYAVRADITKVDKNGKRSFQSIEHKFNDPQKSLLQLRTEAVEKALEMGDLFENGMPEEFSFSSFELAKAKGFKDFNCYSLEIVFIHDEDEDTIYGAGADEALDWLESEAHYYREYCRGVELTTVDTPDGDTRLMLESNSIFFQCQLFVQ